MEAKNDIIVALEFGTSSIRGIAGRKRPDGSVQILGLEKEEALDSIQKGVIYNIDRTTLAIHNIVAHLSDKLGVRITRAYVGLAGQSLHTEPNTNKRNMETTVKITPELIDNMLDINRQTQYIGADILDVVVQEYLVGQKPTTDPVGIQCDSIEARFLNVVAKTSMRENIEKCMRNANMGIADFIISPLALADALLTPTEKRSGCALVDFGAGTTTISYYKENTLRKLVVLPLGGDTITGDIMNILQVDQEEAERMKRKYGLAYAPTMVEQPKQIPISNERVADENQLLGIIAARQEEIVLNVGNQLKDFIPNMLSGIITTGGAAQIGDMATAITQLTKITRVKNARSLIVSADVAEGVVAPQGTSLDTLIALLMKGEVSCTEEFAVEGGEATTDTEKEEEVVVTGEQQTADTPTEEKEKQEVTKKKKEKKTSFWGRVKKSAQKAIDAVTSGEEEED